MDQWATPLMNIHEVLAIPEEFRGKVYQAWEIARGSVEIVKYSSLRYELGEMTKEEAGYLLGFAYLPVRYSMANLTWQNEDPRLPNPQTWTFSDYYSALVRHSGLYNSNREKPNNEPNRPSK